MLALPLIALFALAPRPNAPSEARYDGPVEAWGQADACGSCHAEQHAAWATSAHAHASLNNPWYLASFQSLRAEEGEQASRHCGGCHDPVLLANGGLDGPVGPEHPLGGEGVACLVCHAIQETGYAGNGDYRMDLNALADPADSLKRHKQQMRPAPLEDGTVCRGCHRGFLTPEMGAPFVRAGFDDWGAWEASGWAGIPSSRFDPRKEPVTCVDCHFAAGHAVPGGRTALGAQSGNLELTLELLRSALDVRVPVVWVDDERVVLDGSFAPEAGQEVVLDVTVRNIGAGHSFPGGLADTQDIWLRAFIRSPNLELVAGLESEGAVHFRALPLDADGTPERHHRAQHIGMGAFDRTIPPGEVALVRVAFTAPGGPLDIDVEVVHRSHRPELHAAACEVTGPGTVDGCAPQIAHVIATGTLQSPDAAGLFAHALGMSRGLQEEVGEGLVSLGDRTDPPARVLRARILGTQGRADDAIEQLAGLDPLHPSVWRGRGDALARVWRWDEAARAYAELARLQPRDPASWRDLARARGSAGDPTGAIQAADQGLRLHPRDPILLHSRALGLQALADPTAELALQKWLDHREPDALSSLRARCDRVDDECARERAPIPTVRAEPTPKR